MDGEIIGPRDDRGRFRAGVSGNPGGRPAMDPDVRAAVHEIFQAASVEAAQRLVSLMRDEDSRVSAAAVVHILDRLLGKVGQSAEPSTKANDVGALHIQLLEEIRARRAARLAAEAAKAIEG